MSMTTKDRRKRSAVITGAGSGLGRDIALASQRRIYAACSSGVIGVYQEDDPNHFRKLEDFPVQPMVHSLAVDTATHRVYAPEQSGGWPARCADDHLRAISACRETRRKILDCRSVRT